MKQHTAHRRLTRKPTVAASTAVARAEAFIAEHFLDKPSIRQVAAAVGLSVCHLHREFRKTTGTPPARRVTEFRIAEAKRLLLAGTILGEVARLCKFASASHFCSRFKKVVGESPGHWFRRMRRLK